VTPNHYNSKQEDDAPERSVPTSNEVLSDFELLENKIKKPRTKGISREPPQSPHSLENASERSGRQEFKLDSSKKLVSIGHLSVNSVTDEYYIAAQSETDSQHNSMVKKEMLRYLSRVADRNKPLFVFN
jgi:hypothetical protein